MPRISFRVPRVRPERRTPGALRAVFVYTLRACFPPRRRIGLLFPAAGALLFGLISRTIPDPPAVALASVAGTGLFGVVLPVGGLVIGDAVLGAEVRSGTLHFTWLSPVSFATIVGGRFLGAAVVILGAVAAPFALAGLLAGYGGAVVPLALSATFGAAAYVAIFLALGALTRRAVVWSLAFVLLVERLLGQALSGVAQWCPGWEARAAYAGLASGTDKLLRNGVPEGSGALVRLAIVTVGALAVAAARLGRLRLSGPSGD